MIWIETNLREQVREKYGALAGGKHGIHTGDRGESEKGDPRRVPGALRAVKRDRKGAGTMSQRAVIRAVCISERKGMQKHPVDSVVLRPHHGIEGDAHAGDWHRQVSLLAKESVDRMQAKVTVSLLPGAFAENILCEGIDLSALPVGTRLRVGTALCEVTQIGKECHADGAIRRQAGDCVMPREGVFAVVLEAGEARPGNELVVVG